MRQLLVGCPPSGVLGRALLVSGVSASVRGHRLRALGRPYRRHVATAAGLFREAEAVLAASVGPVNESSMYTHGNLGELLLYDVRDVSCLFACSFVS